MITSSSKNDQGTAVPQVSHQETKKRGRGRPPGSKNKKPAVSNQQDAHIKRVNYFDEILNINATNETVLPSNDRLLVQPYYKVDQKGKPSSDSQQSKRRDNDSDESDPDENVELSDPTSQPPRGDGYSDILHEDFANHETRVPGALNGTNEIKNILLNISGILSEIKEVVVNGKAKGKSKVPLRKNEADNKTIKQAIMHVVLGDNVDGIYPSTRMKESIAKLLEEKTTQQEIQTLLRQRIRPFLSKRCEEAFLKVYGSHDDYKDGLDKDKPQYRFRNDDPFGNRLFRKYLVDLQGIYLEACGLGFSDFQSLDFQEEKADYHIRTMPLPILAYCMAKFEAILVGEVINDADYKAMLKSLRNLRSRYIRLPPEEHLRFPFLDHTSGNRS
ncbi:hypothetical protein PSENEW3_00001244 [Picochlorum sp. SENEW3]|nr:hypothetical protein PSENEW3_00001244 [Picochlorum sp. SENEW3]